MLPMKRGTQTCQRALLEAKGVHSDSITAFIYLAGTAV